MFGYIFCSLNGIVLKGKTTEELLKVITDNSGLSVTDHYMQLTRDEVKTYLSEDIYKLTGIDLPSFLRLDLLSVRIIMEAVVKHRKESASNLDELLDD